MRNRRILILLAAIVILGGLGGGAVLYRQSSLNQQALEARERGMEAAARGDHVAALNGVGRYLQRFGQDRDIEALYAYALARREVPLPNNRHTQSAISLLRRVIVLDPNHPTAKEDLLDLYIRVGFGQESLILAREILEDDPDHLKARSAEALMLARLQRFDEALERGMALAEIDPEDIQNQFLVMQLLQRTSGDEGGVLAYAESQYNKRPDSARLKLLMSVAHDSVGNRDEALQWVEQAAAEADAEYEFVSMLENYLNRLGRYELALDLLERTARQSDESALLRSLARRQLEQGNTAAALELLAEAPLDEQDSAVLGLVALAASHENEEAQLQLIVTELQDRDPDPIATAWASVLQKMFIDTDSSPQEVAEVCEAAIQQDDRNPHFHYFLGMAYERMGESARALQSWQRTVSLSPAWLDPILRSAGLLSNMGRHAEAGRLALEALNRAPRNINVAIATVEVLAAGLDTLTPQDQQRVQTLVESIQESNPMEPRTLPLQARLLARQGNRDAARERIQAVLEHGEPLPESVFVQLASVSSEHGLGLEETLYSRVSEASAVDPTVAMAKALHALGEGDAEGGLRIITEAAQAGGNTVQWQMARARYLEQMGDPEARTIWAAIAEESRGEPATLRAVLASNAAWQDLDLIEEVIESLRAQTGESGITWREYKARWLLQSDPSERAAAEASVMLSEIIQGTVPRTQHFVLMAQALIRLDNEQGAIDNLEQAARLDPNSTAIRLELARLYESRGDMDRAAYNLDHVTSAGTSSREEARSVAAMLARQGQVDRAIRVLVAAYPDEFGPTPPDLVLAQLYRQNENMEHAEAITRQLLDEAPAPGNIAFAADLFAAQGRPDDATEALSKLDELEDLPAGMREIILAEYERRHGNPEAATAHYHQAMEAAPDNAGIRRQAIAFLARSLQSDLFVEALDQAGDSASDNAWLGTLVTERALLADSLERPLAQPLVFAAIESTEYHDEALQALRAIQNAPSDQIDRLAVQLRQLSDRFPRFLTLRMQVARLYGTLGRHSEAASLARDSMRAFPDEIEPVRLAAEAAASAGQWNDALEAAEEWRRRSDGISIDANLMIAEAQTRLNRFSDALRTIRPYLDRVDDDPAAFSPIQFQHVQALVSSGQYEEAAAVVEHRLPESAQWRMAWMRLAATAISDQNVARAWYERVTPLIPEDSTEELLTLSSGWLQLADNTGESEPVVTARNILETVADHPDASGQPFLALAIMADRQGDSDRAEQHYRQALERDPNMVVASNNLAMLLVGRNENLDEALQLAQQAVNAAPLSPTFLDTLAQVHAARGEYDTAVQHLTRAVEIDPNDPRWQEELEAMASLR